MATTGQWINFFIEAGIPSTIASKYATIFHENRIKVDMLLDLNKEYLKDMGIIIMGDIIAILKYAKETHDKVTQEKVLGPDSSASNSPGKHGRYVKKKEHTNDEKRPQESSGPKVNLVNIKRKVSQSEEVPTKKVRRVLPEQEGGYIVKMPLGTTPKTKKLLNAAGLSRKQSIFERLGDSNVSSTTELEPQQFTVTGLNSPLVRTGKGIFSRLGSQQKNERMIINFNDSYDKDVTIQRNDNRAIPGSLAYRGILKHMGVNHTVVKSISANTNKIGLNNGTSTHLGSRNMLFSERRVLTSPQVNGRLTGKLMFQKNFVQQQFSPRNPRVTRKVTGPGQKSMLSRTISLNKPRKMISFDKHITTPSKSVFSRLGSN